MADRRQSSQIVRVVAQRAEGKVRKQYRALMSKHYKEFGSAVRDGGDPIKTLTEMLPSWERERTGFKQYWGTKFAIAGWYAGGTQLGKKRYVLAFAKALPEILVDPEIFGADELIARQLQVPVADWVNMTSKIETATSSQRLGTLVKAALASTNNTTPRDLAAAILQKGITDATARADMLARTLSNWAVNEGSINLYQAEGIGAAEWVSTLDEVTGEWDAAMDGRRVVTGETFVRAGDQFNDSAGNIITASLDVVHPPLHPNCRCTVVPVL